MIEVQYTGPKGWGSVAYSGDAGIDLPIIGEHILTAGERKDIPTGLRIALPEGYYGRITGRSSALRKRGIRVYEGIIDAGFRGELYSFVENASDIATILTPTDRVAQLIVQPVVLLTVANVEELPDSERGERGFGSSDHPSRRLPDQDPKGIMIYIGGPLDFQDLGPRETLIERIHVELGRKHSFQVFDPQVENIGEGNVRAIWDKNMDAIDGCDIVVFLFNDPPNYGFGSPIEIQHAVDEGKQVIIYHRSDNVGVYLRRLWSDFGVIVATEWADFARLLDEEMSKASNG